MPARKPQPKVAWDGGEGPTEVPERERLRDSRYLERVHADIQAVVYDREFSEDEFGAYMDEVIAKGEKAPRRKSSTPLDRAQDLCWDAYEAEGKTRAKLARQALAICEDCADAYVILAEETAETIEQERDLYQKGVEAGVRALGSEFLESHQGALWLELRARPYMRARYGLALCLWELGEREAAVEHLQDLLRLNERDNQGVRNVLGCWLLELGRHDEIEPLLRQFRNDVSLEMHWVKAFWTFRTRGACTMAHRRFREAAERNPTFSGILAGLVERLERWPAMVGLGSLEEAQVAFEYLLPLLSQDEDLFEWVGKELVAVLHEHQQQRDQRVRRLAGRSRETQEGP